MIMQRLRVSAGGASDSVIARVRGPSSLHRDRELTAGLGGDVSLGSFRAPPGRPGVERQFWDCQFISDVVAIDTSLSTL